MAVLTLPAATHWLPLFSATASAVFLVLLPYKLGQLYRASIKARSSWHGKLKAVICALYAALQLFLLLVRLTRGSPSSRAIIESALNLAASLGLVWLTFWVHEKSIRPSNLVIAYLLAKLVCYVLWIPISDRHQGFVLAAAQAFSTLIMLVLENQNKRSILLKAYANESPEATSSFLGNVLFLWINPILATGYGKFLGEDDIPVLDQHTSSKSLRQAMLRAWDQRAKPENGATLPLVLLRCLLAPFMAAILPRVSVIVFRFAQPLLISRAIRFVTQSSVEDHDRSGYWIVVAAASIYIGMAVSTSAYTHRVNRLEIMIRGALIGLLHSHVLDTHGSDEGDGKVVTLMSNDISNLESSGKMFHETWAQFSEVVVGTLLLSMQVGWLWPVPFVIIFFCSQVSRHVANHLKAEQGKWNAATQQRISATGSVLGAIKNIKMLGMQQTVAGYVEDLRKQELDAARGVRWLMVGYNASANALGMFAPVLTMVLYAILARLHGETLDVETAFTSVAILAMITHPANMVMTIIPRAVVSFSSFERIQAYLLGESTPNSSVIFSNSLGIASPIAICIEKAAIAGADFTQPILRDINLEVPQGHITILTGPVGSGKTTLARAMLGETKLTKGAIRVSSERFAYCSQTPWLPNQSIREIIYGHSGNDRREQAWYNKIITACCLDSDLDTLPDGDLTPVGSKGMNLSGGQRQRVALARAIYSRCDIIVLDDSFSALDGKTQGQVVQNLLGPEGVLKRLGVTVVVISTATKHFHLADDIVVLAGGTIKERGTWEQLRQDDPLLDEIIHAADQAPKEPSEKSRRNAVLKRTGEATATGADPGHKNGDLSLYTYYARSAGSLNMVLMITCTILYSFFITIPSYWLKLWTESPNPSTLLFTAGYTLLLLLAWIITNCQMFYVTLRIAPASGLRLHHTLLTAVLGAPLRYFSTTDTGTILNRFSADLHLVDRALAPAAQSLSVQLFKLVAQTALLLASQPFIALSLPCSAVVVYLVQRVYLRTSRQLRLRELEARAAAVGELLETVGGAPTIRAFGWRAAVARQSAAVLDSAQRPLYLLLCLQRWLNVVLDLLIAFIATSTIWLAVWFRGSTTGGQVGVALNVILVANTTLLRLVEGWTGLEISLGAVSRLREVELNTPQEEREGEADRTVSENWPERGQLVFRGVSAAYNPEAIALKSLDLTIEAGQTVVVCGRTGSGKSSLLLSLLRLLDTTKGNITIDGVDVAQLSKSTLRERAFITVAQEAFFLPQASLQFNLDPELKARPSVIVSALKRTGLWAHFLAGESKISTMDKDDEFVLSLPTVITNNTTEDEAILATALNALPALSTGQAQLLALTRALVRRHILCNPAGYVDIHPTKPIVLLDEVTSSLDPVTEGRMYDIIQDEFVDQGLTVVMVTHKLAGIRGKLRQGRDAVVWMGEGRIERVEMVDGEQTM